MSYKDKNKFIIAKILRISNILLFLLYLFVLIFELFFGGYRYHGMTRSYNLIPFRTVMMYITNYKHFNLDILVINLLGNIAAFIPLGFFIPVIFKKANKLSLIIIMTMLFSIIAELIQYVFIVGGLDIDDVILNTLGGIIGFIIYKFLISKNIKYN